MQSKNAFNYIALTLLLLWFSLFNIACIDNLVPMASVPPINIGNQEKVSLAEFMQAAEALAKANDADFAQTLSILKDKYQKLVDKSKLHEGKSNNDRYIFHLLFMNRITHEIADLAEEIYNLSSDKAALLNSILPNGNKPVRVLIANTNSHNDAQFVQKLLIFLVSKDPANIDQLTMGQMHEIFSAITDNATRRRSYLALTDKLGYLQDAFSNDKSSVISLILASLEDDEAKELRTVLIREATNTAKAGLSATTKLENLLRAPEDWGFSIYTIFGVNEKIITLIVKTLGTDLLNLRVQELITSLSAIIKSHMSGVAWPSFSQSAFDIIVNQGLTAEVAWQLLNIDIPYKQIIIDNLNNNTSSDTTYINLKNFLDNSADDAIEEFANFNLSTTKKPVAMLASKPADAYTAGMLDELLRKLQLINSNYINTTYNNGKSLLQILAGDGVVRPTLENENFLKIQIEDAINKGASLEAFGTNFNKIEEVLNKIKEHDVVLPKAFATISLDVIEQATIWAAENYKNSAWQHMYRRGSGAQKLRMRSVLLDKWVTDPTNFGQFLDNIGSWGLGPILSNDIYELGLINGSLIKVLVDSRASEDKLHSLYSQLSYSISNNNLRNDVLKAAFSTARADIISAWVYENGNDIRIAWLFANYIQSLPATDQLRIAALKEKLREFAFAHDGLKYLRANYARFGLDATDDILKTRVQDVFQVARALDGVPNPPLKQQERLLNLVREVIVKEGADTLADATSSEGRRYLTIMVGLDLQENIYTAIKEVLDGVSSSDKAKVVVNHTLRDQIIYLLPGARAQFNDSHRQQLIELFTDKGADVSYFDIYSFEEYVKIFINDKARLKKIYESMINKDVIFNWLSRAFYIISRIKWDEEEILDIKNLFNSIYQALDLDAKKILRSLLLKAAIATAKNNTPSNLKILLEVLHNWGLDLANDKFDPDNRNILTFIIDELKISYLENFAGAGGLIEQVVGLVKQKVDEHNINDPSVIIDWNDFIAAALESARENNATRTILLGGLGGSSISAEELVNYANDGSLDNASFLSNFIKYFDLMDIDKRVKDLFRARDINGNDIFHGLARREQDINTLEATKIIVTFLKNIKLMKPLNDDYHANLVNLVDRTNLHGSAALTLLLEKPMCNEFCEKSIAILSSLPAKILPWNIDYAIRQLDIIYKHGNSDFLVDVMKSFNKGHPTATALIKWMIDQDDKMARSTIKKYGEYLKSIRDDVNVEEFERDEAITMLGFLEKERKSQTRSWLNFTSSNWF